MKHGARNKIRARVKSIQHGSVMSLVKFDNINASQMASVLTIESAEDLELKEGDEVSLVVKAIHVLVAKE